MRKGGTADDAPAPASRSEATYDGQRRTGMVITTHRGFEAYSEVDAVLRQPDAKPCSGYLATFPTKAGATKAIFEAWRSAHTHNEHECASRRAKVRQLDVPLEPSA